MSSQLRKEAVDSESESESDSEEETKSKIRAAKQEPPKQQQRQDEDEDEEESESESDSDSEATGLLFNTTKRDDNLKAVTKTEGADSIPAGKRGRDLNGVKGAPTEEPLSKKRKDAKDGKAHSQAEKLSAPAKKGEKPEQAAKGTKAAAVVKAEKAKAVPTAGKVENAKPQAVGRKRKASTPPPIARMRGAQKEEVDKSSPLKPKKTASWSNAVEESLVSQLQKDHSNGLVIPISKVDPYWEKLLKRLSLVGDMTELQLCEKVRRMRQRYNTLKERPKGEGAKLFKSQHEEKIFKVWADIWDSGTKTSQPTATEEEDSEDESAGTATTATGAVIKGAAAQVQGVDSSDSEAEDDEEEAENVKRKTAGLNQINATSKPITEAIVVTPFISKPRLEFTPLHPKEGKRKVVKRLDEAISGDQHTDDVLPEDPGEKGDVNSLANEHLKQLRDETLAFFQELRGSCFQAIEEQRNGSLTGGLGNIAFAGKGFGFHGMAEGFIGRSGSQPAIELQKKWREHKIQELALLSNRLQLLQEQCRLQQEELTLQNQILDKQ